MMRTAFVGAAVLLSAVLCGCESSGSDERYEALRKEFDSLKREHESLQKENAAFIEEYAKSVADYHTRREKERRNPRQVPIVFLGLGPKSKARLRLHLLDFSKPCPYDAGVMATADVALGDVNILTGGLNLYSARARRYLSENYGVQVMAIASCTDGDELFKVMDAYNAVSKKAIAAMAGKTYTDVLKDAGALGKD